MILETKHINKYFLQPDKQQVLHQVNLQVTEGELVSIYGESGSGKSSLLYILATLDTDFEGELFIKDTSIANISAKELAVFRNKHIGFIYQFHYLLPDFNVLQNIMLPALKLGAKSAEIIKQEALQLLNEVGMEGYSERASYQLSGGQQQRVAIARALINDPALLIADEPTGNLDQKNSEHVFELLRTITEKHGKTVIMATHNATFYKNSHRSIEMIDGVLRL